MASCGDVAPGRDSADGVSGGYMIFQYATFYRDAIAWGGLFIRNGMFECVCRLDLDD